MLYVVTKGAYHPPVVTIWKIWTTGASYLTTGTLCTVQAFNKLSAICTDVLQCQCLSMFPNQYSEEMFQG